MGAIIGAQLLFFQLLATKQEELKVTETDRSASASLSNKEAQQGLASSNRGQSVKQAESNPNSSKPNKKRRTNRRTNNGQNFRSKKRAVYIALDLGTNNCRLMVARSYENGFKVIDGYSRIVRLGENLSKTGELDDEAINRTLVALKACANKIERHRPKKLRLIATQACRSASNSEQFLARVKNEIGLELEIIDQRTEAELAVTGCGDLIEKDANGALMFDIGGGSSELAWLDFRGGRPKAKSKISASIRSWQSLEVGVVSIADKFGGRDVSKQKFEDMVGYVSDKLKAFKGRNKLKQMIKSHKIHLIGTSGTVTTLAGLHLGLERYDRSQVDGLMMRNIEVMDTMRVLVSMPYERRVAHQCIGADRADLVLPGCAIFEAIRREWTTEYIRVADRGLREGILISLMEADRGIRTRKRTSKNKATKQSNFKQGNKNG